MGSETLGKEGTERMLTMKMARIGAQLTQQNVADSMGIHVQTYGKMEANPGDVTIDEAKRFCEIVGRDYREIFFDSDSN